MKNFSSKSISAVHSKFIQQDMQILIHTARYMYQLVTTKYKGRTPKAVKRTVHEHRILTRHSNTFLNKNFTCEREEIFFVLSLCLFFFLPSYRKLDYCTRKLLSGSPQSHYREETELCHICMAYDKYTIIRSLSQQLSHSPLNITYLSLQQTDY